MKRSQLIHRFSAILPTSFKHNNLLKSSSSYAAYSRRLLLGIGAVQLLSFLLPHRRSANLAAASVPSILDRLPKELHDDYSKHEYFGEFTLDATLQETTRDALQQAINRHQAVRGTAIVMDVHTGDLKALAWNDSDVLKPTDGYYNSDIFYNWAISDLYEPGTVFVPLNVAIALDEGAVSPSDTFIDSGKLKVGGFEIRSKDAKPAVENISTNLENVVRRSSPVSAAQLVRRLDPLTYHQRLQGLGIGDYFLLNWGDPADSRIKSAADFQSNPIDVAAAGFGEGFSLSPMQLAQLYGTIANDGKLVRPHIDLGLVDRAGVLQWKAQYKTKQVFSGQTSRTVLDMMETIAVGSDRLAVKTGATFKAPINSSKRPAAMVTAVGIYPAKTPRYVILTVLDEPHDPAKDITATTTIARAIDSRL